MTHLIEVGVCPTREDFLPEKPRRWHVLDCMVPFEGKQIRGRYLIPLELVERPGCDPILVGISDNGAKFQHRVVVPMLDKDQQPVLDEETHEPKMMSVWRDLPDSPVGIPHPARGPMVVVIFPSTRVVRVFESEANPAWVLTTPGDHEGKRMEVATDGPEVGG